MKGISEETAERVLEFRDERDWKQFHNPKDLAISISLEAAELLEVFQWSGGDVSADGRIAKIREELADVAIYCIHMADACGFDLDGACREKMELNAIRYPVKHAYGSSAKYTEFEHKDSLSAYI